MFCKKGALKYLVKLTRKHVHRGLLQKKFQAEAHAKVFFRDIFRKVFL